VVCEGVPSDGMVTDGLLSDGVPVEGGVAGEWGIVSET
jgi:hypothetical protein